MKWGKSVGLFRTQVSGVGLGSSDFRLRFRDLFLVRSKFPGLGRQGPMCSGCLRGLRV